MSGTDRSRQPKNCRMPTFIFSSRVRPADWPTATAPGLPAAGNRQPGRCCGSTVEVDAGADATRPSADGQKSPTWLSRCMEGQADVEDGANHVRLLPPHVAAEFFEAGCVIRADRSPLGAGWPRVGCQPTACPFGAMRGWDPKRRKRRGPDRALEPPRKPLRRSRPRT